MSNEYLIQKETLDNIASQSMSLVGKTAAVSTSDIVNDLTTANTEVGTQADLIEQIKDVINEKFADSNINISDSASTSTSSLSIQNNTTELQNFLTQANDLPDFVNTSDATATASDIANGVTAYVNGEKITGSVKTIEKDASWGFTDCVPQINSSGKVEMRGTWSGNRLYREGSIAFTHSDLSNFGDATAADVVAGKTFTSSAGLKVVGTASSCDHHSVSYVSSYTLNNEEYITWDENNEILTITPKTSYDLDRISGYESFCLYISDSANYSTDGLYRRMAVLTSNVNDATSVIYVEWDGSSNSISTSAYDHYIKTGTADLTFDSTTHTLSVSGLSKLYKFSDIVDNLNAFVAWSVSDI